MRMSKEVIDELMQHMRNIFTEAEEVTFVGVEIEADGQLHIIETPEDMGPIKYPRFPEIHGTVH